MCCLVVSDNQNLGVASRESVEIHEFKTLFQHTHEINLWYIYSLFNTNQLNVRKPITQMTPIFEGQPPSKQGAPFGF